MKFRFLCIAITGLFLLPGCIKHPTETQNIGNFSLDLQWPVEAQSPVLFKKYAVTYTTGKDLFSSIHAFTVPDGFIDTTFVNKSLRVGNGTVSVYFIKAGACTLHIEGFTDNSRSFRDSVPVTVRNPFSISGESLIGAGDPFPSRYSLSPLPSPDSMAPSALTAWSINGIRKAIDRVHIPYNFITPVSGTFTLVATLVDTARNIATPLDTLVIRAPGHRPVVDSMTLVSLTMNAGDSLRFHLFSGDRDSNLSRIIIQETKNRWSDTILPTKGSPYPALLTMNRPLIDTGTYTFSLFAEDSSGLISNAVSGVISVAANPPRIRSVPDRDTLKAAINFPTRLNVTQGAATYIWTVDGVEETGTDPFLQKIFLTPGKTTATITVYGIDKYNYSGPTATIVLIEEDHFYDLSWGHIPADSVFRDSAFWDVRTSRYDRVTANNARFYWTIERLPFGDTIYRTSAAGDSVARLRIDTIAGINFDSVDIKISVILKDSLAATNTSSLLENFTKLRLFRPRVQLVAVTPRSDSVSTGVPFTIKFRASDVNIGGTIDSIRWKYADNAMVNQLSPTDSTFTLTWTAAGKPTVCIWAYDNDSQRSDTLKAAFVVVKNQPRVTGILLHPSVVYTNEPCSLGVTVQKGFSGSRIDSVRIIGPGIAARGIPVGSVLKFGTTFTIPDWQIITVKVYDALGDSSTRVDSVHIASGKPTVYIRSVTPRSDSISTKTVATFKYTVSTARTGFIDSVFWTQLGSSIVNRLKVGGSDSTFKYTWMDAGTVTINIWAHDNVGNTSDISTKSLVIVNSRPSITAFIVPEGSPPTKLPFNYTISAQPGFSGARITRYHWVYPVGSEIKDSAGTGSTLSLAFPTAGEKIIAVYAIDSLNDTTAWFIDTINIDPGLPVVKSMHLDSSASGGAVFVTDPIKVTITAGDPNGPIASYKVVLVKGAYTDSAQGPTPTLTLKVPVGNEGTCSLSVFVKDEDGQWSAAYPATPLKLNIRAAKPVVTGFVPPSGLWIYDTLAFRYSARDTNNGLSKIIFDWKDGSKDTVQAPRKDSVLNRAVHHRYTTAGTFAVSVTVVDVDNQSTPGTYSITIDPGLPVVKSVIIDTSASGNAIYVNDPIVVKTIEASDPNGPIASYKAVLVKGAYTDSAQGPTTPLSLRVPVGNEGIFSLNVFVKDEDGQWSAAYPATPIKLNVRAAKPVVTGFTPPSQLWIYDTLTFRYSARDTNGGLTKIIFDWKDGSKDTVQAPRKDSVQNRAIVHRYENAGTFAATVTAVDEDGQTTMETYNIIIHEGRPTVSVKDMDNDTLVTYIPFIWKTEADSIHFVANAFDTNGTINNNYSWYLTEPFDASAPDTLITTANSLTIKRGSVFWNVHGRFNCDTTYSAKVMVEDNDGFFASDTFYFYYETDFDNFDIVTRCKNGHPWYNPTTGQVEWDRNWFDFYKDPNSGFDSIEVSLYPDLIPANAGQFYRFSLDIIVTGGQTMDRNVVSFNDTITLCDSVPVSSYMRFDNTNGTWIKMWRPPLNFFSAYREKNLEFLNFHFISTMHSRTGRLTTWEGLETIKLTAPF